MIVKILSAASKDLVNGHKFYERQSPGVGEYFIDEIFAEIDTLKLNGGIHPKYIGTYHRMLCRRFPYAIFYRVEADTVVVHAVLDCRSDPTQMRKRLKG